MPGYDLYLAAPFFNPVQVATMEELETLCQSKGVSFFSPRLHAPQMGPEATPEQQAKTFAGDVEGINKSCGVLAHLDWMLPRGETVLRRVSRATGVEESELHIPDNGTVWEMGYARGIKKLVVGWTLFKDRRINLMITCGCDLFLRGIPQVATFLDIWHSNTRNGVPQISEIVRATTASLPESSCWKGRSL